MAFWYAGRDFVQTHFVIKAKCKHLPTITAYVSPLPTKSKTLWGPRNKEYSRTLSQHNKNEEHSKEHSSFLVRRKGHSCEPSSQLISFADYGFATVTGFTLFAKNSPPDCFLNAKTLSGFESLQPKNNKKAIRYKYLMAFLVRRKGLEPPTYWFVAVSIAVKQALNSDV